MEKVILDPKVKKNFGFGCMRLPMQGKEVDMEEFTKMVDAFLAAGFNYFDTAHGYLEGKSEPALKAALTSRYPREDYVLTDKLTSNYFNKEEDIRPFFESQLEACGVEYFDFYLMHAQDRNNFEKYKRCRAYETAFGAQGRGEGAPRRPLLPRQSGRFGAHPFDLSRSGRRADPIQLCGL